MNSNKYKCSAEDFHVQMNKHDFVFCYLADEEFEELCFDFGLELDEVVRDVCRVW